MTMAKTRLTVEGAWSFLAFIMLIEAIIRRIKSVPSKKARIPFQKTD